MRCRSLRLWFAFALCLGLWATSHAHANPPPPNNGLPTYIEAQQEIRLLPKGTQVALTLSSLSKISRGLTQTSLAKLLAEPELKPLKRWWKKNRKRGGTLSFVLRRFGLGGVLSGLESTRISHLFDKLLQQLAGMRLSEATALFDGPHVFSVVRVPIGSERLQLAAILRYSDQSRAQKLVDTLLQQIPVKRADYKIGNQSVQLLQGLETNVHFTFLPNHVLFATTQDLLKDMLSRANGQGIGLDKDPLFLGFLHATQFRSGLSLYVATESLLKQAALTLEPQFRSALSQFSIGIQDIFDGLGFSAWKSAGITLQTDGSDFVSRFHLSMDPSKLRGFSRFLSLPSVDGSLSNYAPARTFSAIQTHIPLAAIWSDLDSSLKKLAPPLHAYFMQNVVRVERAFLNGTIEQTLRAFGQDFSIFFYNPKGTLWPSWIQVLKLQDQPRVHKLLSSIAGVFAFELKSTSYEGYKIYRIAPIRFVEEKPRKKLAPHAYDHSPRGYRRHRRYRRPRPYPRYRRHAMRQQQIPAVFRALRLVYVDSHMILAPTPHSIRDLIDSLRSPSPKTLAMRANFKQTASRHGFSAHASLRKQATFLYQTMLGLLPILYTGERSLARSFPPIHAFPRAHTLLKHLQPTRATLLWSAPNSTATLRSSFGLEWLLTGASLLSTGEFRRLQRSLSSALRDLSDLQELNKSSKIWEEQAQFSVAAQQWAALQQRAQLSSVLLIARKHAERFKSLQTAQRRTLQAALQKSYKDIPGDFDIDGDWVMTNGALEARTISHNQARLTFGDEMLKNYTLSFEVANAVRGFSLQVHKGSTHDSFANKLYFGGGRFQAQGWTLVRVKVRGHRLSYWFGLAHTVRHLSSSQGRIQLTAYGDSRLQIRNFQLKIEETSAPRVILPKRPILQAHLTPTQSVTQVGQESQYTLTLRNIGGAAAQDIDIRLHFNDIARFVRFESEPKGVFIEKDRNSGHYRIHRIPSLGSKQTLRITLVLSAKQAGSALVQAFLSLANSPLDIALETRSHFVNP